MGKPIAIPRILGIDWWWLMLVGMMEGFARYALHVPLWVPTISGFWFLLQAGWLRVAEPRSRAIFLYLTYGFGSIGVAAMPSYFPDGHWLSNVVGVVLGVIGIAGIFVFRSEMVRHFTETDPRGIELGGVMTFFFSGLYFQYWFHQIYVEQNEADLRVT
jgi:hypothetical protein